MNPTEARRRLQVFIDALNERPERMVEWDLSVLTDQQLRLIRELGRKCRNDAGEIDASRLTEVEAQAIKLVCERARFGADPGEPR